ncbi:MAG: hypothetical protein BMS9Abin36_0976 [Gammaproteobacteria bacterium]|nr:MAG: hypothetical protein BMS9Abin36_0976 [Gammaproteobacteria bacterium]
MSVILIVDDNARNLYLLRFFLRTVSEAGDAEQVSAKAFGHPLEGYPDFGYA